MDGIHDLGGMPGFGPIEIEKDEPVFHEQWEGLAFALNALGIVALHAYNTDEYRHSIERMPPLHYLNARYYERVLTGVASLLVEKGIVTREELERRAGGSFPLASPVAADPCADLAPQPTARFAVGDAVIVRDIHPGGHTRVPRYVRGKRGTVLFVAPKFSFPDAAAHGGAHREEHTYHVEFDAKDLWADAAASQKASAGRQKASADRKETIVVDLWDSYLEPA